MVTIFGPWHGIQTVAWNTGHGTVCRPWHMHGKNKTLPRFLVGLLTPPTARSQGAVRDDRRRNLERRRGGREVGPPVDAVQEATGGGPEGGEGDGERWASKAKRGMERHRPEVSSRCRIPLRCSVLLSALHCCARQIHPRVCLALFGYFCLIVCACERCFCIVRWSDNEGEGKASRCFMLRPPSIEATRGVGGP